MGDIKMYVNSLSEIKMYVTPITKVYLGSTQIWPDTVEPDPELSIYTSSGFSNTSYTIVDDSLSASSTTNGTPYITYDFLVAKQIRAWTVEGNGQEDREYLDSNRVQ